MQIKNDRGTLLDEGIVKRERVNGSNDWEKLGSNKAESEILVEVENNYVGGEG